MHVCHVVMPHVHNRGMASTTDLNALRVLEAVVTHRSVSRAADSLGLSQPAVSHTLRRLRRLLDDDLVVRTSHGVDPTQRALEICAVLAHALADIDGVVDRSRAFDPSTAQRRFRLLVSDYVAPLLVADLAARVQAGGPDLALEVDHFRADSSRIDPGEMHVRIATAEKKNDEPVEVERLIDDEFVVLMRAGHPAARAPLTLETYLGLSHVKVSAEALGTNLIDDALLRRGLSRRVSVAVPHWLGLHQVIAQTDLVLAVPRRWANDPTMARGCVHQPLPLSEVTYGVDLRWRVRDRHDAGLQWLRGQIRESLTQPGRPSSRSAALPPTSAGRD